MHLWGEHCIKHVDYRPASLVDLPLSHVYACMQVHVIGSLCLCTSVCMCFYEVRVYVECFCMGAHVVSLCVSAW